MKVNEAEKILQDKKDAELAEVEAKKVLEEDRLRKIKEAEEQEKKRKKEEFEAEKLKYPGYAAEIHQSCWKCGKVVNMSQGEHITRSTRIIIVAECQKCGSYNVAAIPTNNAIISPHDRFLPGIDLR